MNQYKILLAAGGTGGHMFPASAVAENLIAIGHQVHFITDVRGAQYLSRDSSQSVFNLSALGRRTLPRIPLAIWQMLCLSLSCLLYFIRNRPDRVVGFGGYVTYPVLLLSRIFRVPYYIHEQNSVMGLVNRWFAGGAAVVITSFPNTQYAGVSSKVLGIPVRGAISSVRDIPYVEPSTDFKVLVLGGSQGASIFSTVIPEAFAKLPDDLRAKFTVVQQCRKEDIQSVQQAYDKLNMRAHLASFFEDMAAELASAQLVISRSGASTMAELTIVGRPAIFVPYPGAMDDHQTGNAKYATDAHAGWLVTQPLFTADSLSATLQNLLRHPNVLTQAAAAMKALGKCSAAQDIVAEITAVK